MPGSQHGNISLSLKFVLGVYYGPAGMSFTFLYLPLEKNHSRNIFVMSLQSIKMSNYLIVIRTQNGNR